MASNYDALLSDSWRLVRGSADSRPRPMTVFDLAFGTRSLADSVFGRFVQMPTWDVTVPAAPLPLAVGAPSSVAAGVIEPPLPPKLKLASTRAHPAEEDIMSRRNALNSWVSILNAVKGASATFIQLQGSVTIENLQPYLATRRTGTLATRASAWRLFVKWADETGADLEELSEPLAFAYLQHLKEIGGPPTRADTFLRGCFFAYGLRGVQAGHCIATSARCRGLAAVSMAEKRIRLQRDPLWMAWVTEAEKNVVLAANSEGVFTLSEAAVMGFLLFCVHARTRCSDTAKVTAEPTLDLSTDLGKELFSYIETVTSGDAIKTGNTVKKARLAIPMVGLAYGISGEPWAEAWLDIRTTLGLNADEDGCLMRSPLADGSFAIARNQPGEATQWLRHLMLALKAPPMALKNVGSHSCKATLLSVAAKCGISRDARRTLGGHANPGDSSVDCYSRDTMAAPRLELALLL